ncbi:hypothetical protein ACTWP5_02295 [Streptomyces sp. 4N509B]|uniref:hypothetical protein n=1 Tax=Streptomyces sp. 4N509B TaxID=3457413 RepID=UPI003FD16033
MSDSPLHEVTAAPPAETAADVPDPVAGDGPGTDPGPAAPLTSLGSDNAPVCADGVCAL